MTPEGVTALAKARALAIPILDGPMTLEDAMSRAMPLVTAGQQPVFADDRTAFDALSRTNLNLRQIVFLPLAARVPFRPEFPFPGPVDSYNHWGLNE